jgi:uncharacterized protein
MHTFLLYVIYGLIGVVAGLLGGLLGISGGVIIVPLLVLIFKYNAFPPEYLMHLAIGTSLAAMVINSLAAAYSHHLRGSVLWDVFRSMLPGLIIGSLIGAVIARFLPSSFLQKIFGGFECLIGLYFLLPYRPPKGAEQKKFYQRKLALNGISFGVGSLSNILGIGGGTFMVPTLMTFHLPAKNAIGTSAAMGTLTSFIGALSYLSLGIMQKALPDSIGFLYLPAFISISITTFLFAPLGAKLAHHLSTVHLRRIFAFALLSIGVAMLL